MVEACREGGIYPRYGGSEREEQTRRQRKTKHGSRPGDGAQAGVKTSKHDRQGKKIGPGLRLLTWICAGWKIRDTIPLSAGITATRDCVSSTELSCRGHKMLVACAGIHPTNTSAEGSRHHGLASVAHDSGIDRLLRSIERLNHVDQCLQTKPRRMRTVVGWSENGAVDGGARGSMLLQNVQYSVQVPPEPMALLALHQAVGQSRVLVPCKAPGRSYGQG